MLAMHPMITDSMRRLESGTEKQTLHGVLSIAGSCEPPAFQTFQSSMEPSDNIDFTLFLPTPPDSPVCQDESEPRCESSCEAGESQAGAEPSSDVELELVAVVDAGKEVWPKPVPVKKRRLNRRLNELTKETWWAFEEMETACNLQLVETQPTKNCCLAFSYLLSSGGISEAEQRTECAAPFLPRHLQTSTPSYPSLGCCP